MSNMNTKKIKEIIEKYFDENKKLAEKENNFLNGVIEFEIDNEYNDDRKDNAKRFISNLLKEGEK